MGSGPDFHSPVPSRGWVEARNSSRRRTSRPHRWVDGPAQPPYPELADRFGPSSWVTANSALAGWDGLKTSLLGVGLGLLVLLPFVLLRSLGAGDWKLAGALGAFTGPGILINLLLGSVFVAGVMALALVIYEGRTIQTMRNIGHILISLVTFRLPGSRVSLDNPDSLKVPYGVALAFTVVLYGIFWKIGAVA